MMDGVLVILCVNIAVGLFFSLSYGVLALAIRSQKKALWFCAAYLLGTLSPFFDLLSSFLHHPVLLEWAAYGCFLAGLLTMPVGFASFHNRRPWWKISAAIFLFGLIMHGLLPLWPRGTMLYSFAYQTPFVLASLLGTVVVFRTPDKTRLYLLTGYVFMLTALHFFGKPFLLSKYREDYLTHAYAKTAYALFSQAGTGVLLLACGILLFAIVTNKALRDSEDAANTDPLSQIRNRRGFDLRAEVLMRRAIERKKHLSVALLDIDYFKTINDTAGHEVGDAVIRKFAALLRETMPSETLIGRMGGDEFALLLKGATADGLRGHAEAMRMKFKSCMEDRKLPATMSGGITEIIPGESFSAAMRRADRALYQAKENGRNCVLVLHRETGTVSNRNKG